MDLTNEISNIPTLKPQKVLIADDDEPTRMLLHAAISQWGYEVIEAVDGENAWEILQKNNIELLILDWLMPKLDGIELCKRIRNELKYHPYIIMLTQIAGTTNIIAGLDAGADEFLSKPFNIAELKTRILVGIRILKYETQLIEQASRVEMSQVLVKQILKKIEEMNKNIFDDDEKKLSALNDIVGMIQTNLKKIIE